MRKIILLCFICWPLLTFSKERELYFGVYTSDKPSDMVRKFKPLLDQLQQRLNTQLEQPIIIKLKVLSSYEKGIKAIVEGEVDFVRFGPASYVLSVQQNPDISLLAMESYKGHKSFKGIIAVQKNSPINQLSELKGVRFAFGDEHSTIGRYLSQLALLNAGIKADDLASYSYLGRHDKVGAVVSTGHYAAGALKESSFIKLVNKGANLRKLYEFENVTKPWLASSNLDPGIVNALKQSLLDMPGFLISNKQDYDVIKQAINKNAQFFQ